jgi:hypothetical protein
MNRLLDMLQDPPDCTSSPTAKSSLEKKAESEPELASVSPELGEEAGNHFTGCYSDGKTSNTVAPTECHHNSQGDEATAGNQVRKTLNYIPSAIGCKYLFHLCF